MANPLTVAEYTARMQHAIGNSSPATGFSLLEVLNEALRHLFTYADWTWKHRAPALLTITQNVSFVPLPSDFGTSGELLSVHSVWSPEVFVEKVSLGDIADLRGSIATTYTKFYVAVSYPTQTAATSRPGAARLEIWPTPAETITSAFRVNYKSGPVDLTGNTDVPNVPREYEAALTLLARAMILRYEAGADSPAYLSEMKAATDELERLREADGAVDPDAGALSPGAAAAFIPARGKFPFRPFVDMWVR